MVLSKKNTAIGVVCAMLLSASIACAPPRIPEQELDAVPNASIGRDASGEASPPDKQFSIQVDHPLVVLNAEGEDYAIIKYSCPKAMVLDLIIYTRFPQDVKTLFHEKAHEAGDYEIRWDGRDDFESQTGNGYYFVKVVDSQAGTIVFDSAETRWGAPIVPTEVTFNDNGSFRYRVPTNALVRIGAANKQSAMYYGTLLDWAPRPKGSHFEQWTGYDSHGKVPLLGRPDLTMHVRSYSLPEVTLFVVGSSTDPIPVRREGTKYIFPPEGLGEVSPFSQQEDIAARTPVFTLHAQNYEMAHVELQGAELTEPLIVHIVLHPDTQAGIGTYSIKAFVDDELIGLAEPADPEFSFLLDPDSLGTGEHLLNVNLISYAGGHVGAELRSFEVPAKLTAASAAP